MNSAQLKQRLLAQYADMTAHNHGRIMLLIFDEDLGAALDKACESHSDCDAIVFACAAQIVCQQLFKNSKHFNGSFEECWNL